MFTVEPPIKVSTFHCATFVQVAARPGGMGSKNYAAAFGGMGSTAVLKHSRDG